MSVEYFILMYYILFILYLSDVIPSSDIFPFLIYADNITVDKVKNIDEKSIETILKKIMLIVAWVHGKQTIDKY